ncbi:hypothetical protein ILYODFUR_034823 [Ilyodon furcidens]|uniref:Uncharacterized protein n=1 Tax=Ilyodon furcidens TaxID=33524 RepID=A0ABV0U4I7_9TELE
MFTHHGIELKIPELCCTLKYMKQSELFHWIIVPASTYVWEINGYLADWRDEQCFLNNTDGELKGVKKSAEVEASNKERQSNSIKGPKTISKCTCVRGRCIECFLMF